jgi:hypothetical protein
MRTVRARFERFAERCEVDPLYGNSAEALLHEMAHAVVFGWSLRELGNLAGRVSKRYDRMHRAGPCALSDRTEARALAVERLAARALHWRLPWSTIVEGAADTCSMMMRTELVLAIDRYERDARTKRLAERVVQRVRSAIDEREVARCEKT